MKQLSDIQNLSDMLRNFSNQVTTEYYDLYINSIDMLNYYITSLEAALDKEHDQYDEMDMMCLDAENKQLKQQLQNLTQENNQLRNFIKAVI